MLKRDYLNFTLKEQAQTLYKLNYFNTGSKKDQPRHIGKTCLS